MIAAMTAFAYSKPGWKLVWADEFNQGSKPDPKNWTYQTGFVRNQEPQWYQPQNASIQNGMLIIEGKKETVINPNFQAGSTNWKLSRFDAPYTSSCLITKGLHSWLYGRFEFRAKFNPNLGSWPAIWFLGVQKQWPHNGEIDLMEYYHHTLLANACWGNGTWKTVRTPISNFIAQDPKWTSKFHVWRMDWDENWIRLYVDNQLENEVDLSKTVDSDGYNPFHHPMYLLVNQAIGATGGDPSSLHFPVRFELDWARVYQKS